MELWQAPITDSAHRHGSTDQDIRHALRNMIAVAVADDPENEDVTLLLGPDQAVNLIEVGVLATDDGPPSSTPCRLAPARFPPYKE